MRDYETAGACVSAKASITEHFDRTTSVAADAANRAQTLAGRLAGHYPPKSAADGKSPPEPGDVASRLELSNARTRGYLDDIMSALNAIEDRLS